MEISIYKSRAKTQLKQVAYFFLRVVKRKSSFFFFTPEKALRNADNKTKYLHNKPDLELEIINRHPSAGLVLKEHVISIPLKKGKEKEYCGGLVDIKTMSLIQEAVHLMGESCQELPQEKIGNLFQLCFCP